MTDGKRRLSLRLLCNIKQGPILLFFTSQNVSKEHGANEECHSSHTEYKLSATSFSQSQRVTGRRATPDNGTTAGLGYGKVGLE